MMVGLGFCQLYDHLSFKLVEIITDIAPAPKRQKDGSQMTNFIPNLMGILSAPVDIPLVGEAGLFSINIITLVSPCIVYKKVADSLKN
jgi:hypothetical protein